MKTKCLLFCLILFGSIAPKVGGQLYAVKSYSNETTSLGGDAFIKESHIMIDGKNTYRVFEVEVPEEGDYHLNAWLMAAETKDGYLPYDILVNGEKSYNRILPERCNWQSIGIVDAKRRAGTVRLKKGTNTIAISAVAPEIAEVEFIRLSKDPRRARILDTNYRAFIEEIEREVQEASARGVAFTSMEDSLSTVEAKSGQGLANPAGNYHHRMNVSIRYTTYKTYSFNAGQQVFFTTYAPSGYQHVLEVFSKTNPQSHTWVNLSNSSGLASINITIPATGVYYVRVRAWRQRTQGLVDLNVNGQYYFTNCAVSGNGFRWIHTGSTTYNYFTTHRSSDPRIWIEDNTGIPGRIRAENDDYYGSGDFNWSLNSRVKRNFGGLSIGAVLLSAYGSHNPVGTCDLYAMCQDGTAMSWFPNLKADDAIQSATSSGVYNCISWSGGIIDYWEWPPSSWSQYYKPGDPLGSFDKFYDTVRYINCMRYTSNGATVSNSMVDLWALNGSYTHASVTKVGNDGDPANYHPHGYAWESKAGSLERFFHPRHALNGSTYGAVDKYYRQVAGTKSMTLQESLAEGLSVIEHVGFSVSERARVMEMRQALPLSAQDAFETKYNAWVATWALPEVAIHSDPRMYANSKEYDELIVFCRKQGRAIWPMVFEKLEQGDFLAINALEDLTLADNIHVLEAVKEENLTKSHAEGGEFIVRSPYINAMKYVKRLLASPEVLASIDEGIKYSNCYPFAVYPNPSRGNVTVSFALLEPGEVSIRVYDLKGRLVATPMASQRLAIGDYAIPWNQGNVAPGVYLMQLTVGGVINVKKLMVTE
jgi:hypothetical protein